MFTFSRDTYSSLGNLRGIFGNGRKPLGNLREIFGNGRKPLGHPSEIFGKSSEMVGNPSDTLRKWSGTPRTPVGIHRNIFGDGREPLGKGSFFSRKTLRTSRNPFGTLVGTSSSSLRKKKEMSLRGLEPGTFGVQTQRDHHWTTASHTLQEGIFYLLVWQPEEQRLFNRTLSRPKRLRNQTCSVQNMENT